MSGLPPTIAAILPPVPSPILSQVATTKNEARKDYVHGWLGLGATTITTKCNWRVQFEDTRVYYNIYLFFETALVMLDNNIMQVNSDATLNILIVY